MKNEEERIKKEYAGEVGKRDNKVVAVSESQRESKC